MPANWPAVEVFLACSTQWRFAGMDGVATGLDYAGVRAALVMMRVPPARPLFEDLQVMELAALKTLHARGRRK